MAGEQLRDLPVPDRETYAVKYDGPVLWFCPEMFVFVCAANHVNSKASPCFLSTLFITVSRVLLLSFHALSCSSENCTFPGRTIFIGPVLLTQQVGKKITSMLGSKPACLKMSTKKAADENRTRDLRTTNATHYRLCYNSLKLFRVTNDIISRGIFDVNDNFCR